jgi:F0F1-type ATP synthase membrane subunit c/vacuolar-type H+-ATPase subunit K
MSPLFPDKAKMVRSANALLAVFAVAPVVYLLTEVLATFGRPGLARDPSVILPLFLGLVLVSLATIRATVFVQTSTKVMPAKAGQDPIGRTYLKMSTSAILSEAHAIYGLVLTLLSGSIFYGIGFAIVTWASLWWVRKRFKRSLGKLPNA